MYGLDRIVDVGLAWTPELGIVYPQLRVIGAILPAQDRGQAPTRYPFGRPIDISDSAAAGRLTRIDVSTSALMVSGPSSQLCGADGVFERLSDLATSAPLLVLATDDAEPVLRLLAGIGLQPEFSGRTRLHAADDRRSGHLMVVDTRLAQTRLDAGHVPGDFRVVAIMTAYNEEDVIGPAIEKLIGDGVGVYVIDNWSTDRTYEIVRGFDGKGLVGSERFPETPSDRFVLQALLRRVAAVAVGQQASWCVHHDADERRSGPWPGLGLRDSLWRVDRAGFSAVDHTVINYRPIDNTFRPGSDFERHFRHFEFGTTPDLLLQIKAWKNVGPVDLAGLGGHQAVFAGRRVFPYKFLLKHYPIRSQTHGEQKVYRDRVPRWDPGERAQGWHWHYDSVAPGQSFLRDPVELIEDHGEETRALYMLEMLTGAGLAPRHIPRWAVGGSVGMNAYLALRAIARSPLRPLLTVPRTLIRRLRKATDAP
jgi:hypothetical protein